MILIKFCFALTWPNPTSHMGNPPTVCAPFSRKTISCYYYLSVYIRRTRSIRDSCIYIYHSPLNRNRLEFLSQRRRRAGCWGGPYRSSPFLPEWSADDWLQKLLKGHRLYMRCCDNMRTQNVGMERRRITTNVSGVVCSI
jgi:hypothetical protein